jgi:hypothetical protein
MAGRDLKMLTVAAGRSVSTCGNLSNWMLRIQYYPRDVLSHGGFLYFKGRDDTISFLCRALRRLFVLNVLKYTNFM